jgi:hypothetical protein
MEKVIVKQMPVFKRAYKKLHPNEKEVVNDVIKRITQDPKIGEGKKGDLFGIYVYQFKFRTKEFLLSYLWNPKERILLALGVHENFYRDLKKGL